jgi:hypothetical protein
MGEAGETRAKHCEAVKNFEKLKPVEAIVTGFEKR